MRLVVVQAADRLADRRASSSSPPWRRSRIGTPSAGLEVRGRGEAESFARILRGLSRSVSADAIVSAILDDLIDATAADHVVLVRAGADAGARSRRRSSPPRRRARRPPRCCRSRCSTCRRSTRRKRPTRASGRRVPGCVPGCRTSGRLRGFARRPPSSSAFGEPTRRDRVRVAEAGSRGRRSGRVGAACERRGPGARPMSGAVAPSLRRIAAESLALLRTSGCRRRTSSARAARPGLGGARARRRGGRRGAGRRSRAVGVRAVAHAHRAAALRAPGHRRDRPVASRPRRLAARARAASSAAPPARPPPRSSAPTRTARPPASASTDPLTGLPNRRYFDEFSALLAGRRRAGRRVAVLMIDIDKFKGLNDTYGHPVGDQVLRSVAGAITSAVRDQDVPARIGGEEFAVLLRNPGPTVALEVGERVRQAVRELDLGGLGVPGVSVSRRRRERHRPRRADRRPRRPRRPRPPPRQARRPRPGDRRLIGHRRLCQSARVDTIAACGCEPATRRRAEAPTSTRVGRARRGGGGRGRRGGERRRSRRRGPAPDERPARAGVPRHRRPARGQGRARVQDGGLPPRRGRDRAVPVEVARAYREGRPPEIPGVGKAIADKLAELATTGRSEYRDKLLAEFPTSLLEMLRLPGLGPKTVRADLHRARRARRSTSCKAAAESRRLRTLRGLSERTEQLILEGIAKLEKRDRRLLLNQAKALDRRDLERPARRPRRRADRACGLVPAPEGVDRRPRPARRDGLARSSVVETFVEACRRSRRSSGAGAHKAAVRLGGRGPQVDLMVMRPERGRHAPDPLHGLEGAQRPAPGDGPRQGLEPVRVRLPADRRGRRAADRRRRGAADVRRPRRRRTRSSGCRSSSRSCARTPARSRRRSPGTCRPSWPRRTCRATCTPTRTGPMARQPVEVMAEFARRRGHAYQVMTDHTQSLAIARGLTPERVEEERALIRGLNERFVGGGERPARRRPRRTPRAFACSTAASSRSGPTASSTTPTSCSRRSTSSSPRCTSRGASPAPS